MDTKFETCPYCDISGDHLPTCVWKNVVCSLWLYDNDSPNYSFPRFFVTTIGNGHVK